MGLIYAVVFLGFFAGALVAPILSPLFLHPDYGGILPASSSAATKAFYLGTVLAAIRSGEFLGSPILGQLSDRYGRKRILAIATTIGAVGNLVVADAIIARNVWILIAGQFMIGFVGVLLVLVQAEIAHHVSGSEKTRRFGLVYMASSLAFVFGPTMGGYLGDASLFRWASHALPFFVSALVHVATVLLILWRFPDTPPVPQESRFDVASGFREIGDAFRSTPFRTLLAVNFVLYLGIDFVFQFNPVYFVQTWEFTSSQVGWFLSYTSISMVAAQWLLVGPVGSRWGPRAVTSVSAAGLGVLLGVLVMPDRWFWLYAILPAVGSAMALATTNMSALLSDTAPADRQGRMLGVSHSVRVLGSALLCFGGGILAGHSPKLPILVAAVASILAAVLLALPGKSK